MKGSDYFADKYGLKEEILDDVSDWEYHYGKYRKCLGSSGYSALKKSALHYKVWRDRPVEDLKENNAFTFGKAWHVYNLEPDLFQEKFHVIPKIRRSTSKGKPSGEWAKTLEEADNRTVLWEEDLKKIIEMAKGIRLSKTASAILRNPGKYERTYIWKDDYGIWNKCRTDIDIKQVPMGSYAVNIIGDLKSTTNADPFGFGKSVANYGYDIQAAHYVAGANRLVGQDHEFVFVAQEKDEPYAASVFHIDRPTIMDASEKIDPLKQRLAKALRTGIWEAYPDEILPLQLPGWYK